jgi:hypothetical protein
MQTGLADEARRALADSDGELRGLSVDFVRRDRL